MFSSNTSITPESGNRLLCILSIPNFRKQLSAAPVPGLQSRPSIPGILLGSSPYSLGLQYKLEAWNVSPYSLERMFVCLQLQRCDCGTVCEIAGERRLRLDVRNRNVFVLDGIIAGLELINDVITHKMRLCHYTD